MIKEIAYQAQAVDELVEKCAKLMGLDGVRKKLVFKAPTGAGKTVMASRMLERRREMFHAKSRSNEGCGRIRRPLTRKRSLRLRLQMKQTIFLHTKPEASSPCTLAFSNRNLRGFVASCEILIYEAGGIVSLEV